MGDGAAPARRGVLGVGIATLDIVNEVQAYPAEDEEVRALRQDRRIGGNVTNTLGVLSALGHPCAWCGALADDRESAEVLAGLRQRGIDTSARVVHPSSRTPTSYITLSRATGSRTIVHHRELAELRAADFRRVALDAFSWIHFEGRSPEETAAMLRDCRRRRPGVPLSLEIEKPRPGIRRLFRGPRVIVFSRAFALACGFRDPEAFLAAQWEETSAELLFLPWGAEGAFGQCRGQGVCCAPPLVPPQVRDTIGAGDVFNAGVIDGLLCGLGLPEVLARATRLAGHKCGRRGLGGLVESARESGLL
jgi:ketohexokinase